jgi:hypothetical protein
METTAQQLAANHTAAGASDTTFIPNSDGTWSHYPDGFWRVGYRIDEATRKRLQEIGKESLLPALSTCILSVCGGLAIAVHGPSKSLAFFGDNSFHLFSGTFVFLMIFALTVIWVWQRRRIREVLVNFSLSPEMMSRREARARWVGSWLRASSVNAKVRYLYGSLSAIGYLALVYVLFPKFGSIGYVWPSFLVAMAVWSLAHHALLTVRLIAYRRDLRESGGGTQ